MNEGKRLSAAQWIVLATTLLNIFSLWAENRSGNIINTTFFFWLDAAIYGVSFLIGFGLLSYFHKREVRWTYRSSISNALWWMMAGALHFVISWALVISSLIFFGIALINWYHVLLLMRQDWHSRN